ncbi:LLM class flavin-dependent oxidoreductase [Xinfangfangia sp. D13-10-4-6]|uniref:LLM class flavin-dependent oxidoreductase n=1 Tax=Pseudogemmobacter hezensis TaxID=2737662 RepID=UPI0015567DCA|nr:LLM class flavin-dependent oxidoreductase [Pseudogemmobacter hezensis]NPD16047.1 LLM class flavin-dependent oxidoreductase [Pseudogemmobacter hezensis]
MTRKIRFNAFDMNCVGHQSPGLWAHPDDRSATYKDLDYWQNLARTLERGIFDGIFIADVIGYYDVYNGNNDGAIRNGAQIPVNDPIQLAAPIALATQHLGIGITASTSFEHPYTFARRIATADHHTKGRVGWNIVTSYLESGAKNIGQGGLKKHDNRYEVASEYLEVIYKLLEGSWEEDAVRRDADGRIFADPAKVHEIGHKGKYFEVPGYGLTEPSPQRTPLIYQAGASGPGKAFAAKHAECVFVGAPSKALLKEYVADIRARAAAEGRDPSKLYIYTLITIITDETEEKARAKFEDYSKYISYEGSLVFMSGWSGVDFGAYQPGEVIRKVETNAIHSMLDAFGGKDKVWTVDELAKYGGIGGQGPVFVGSPEQIADTLQDWVAETDVDGFNIAYAVTPGSFEDVVNLIVPELQKRGAYPTEYTPGTLREKLFGAGPYLPENHPAQHYRDIEAVKAAETAKEAAAE